VESNIKDPEKISSADFLMAGDKMPGEGCVEHSLEVIEGPRWLINDLSDGHNI